MSGPGEEPPASEAPGHPEIVRIRAPNPGPMTLSGTNTYVVGSSPAWVIDPGPAAGGHIAEVRDVAEARGGIGGVVLTHSHSDHTGGVEMLGARVDWGDASGVDEAEELGVALERGDRGQETEDRGPVAVEEFELGPFRVLPTPGHARDHVAFVLGAVCFCGDLVLGEGSSIVPPRTGGGSLVDYMDSLAALGALGSKLLCPGHGPWITDPEAKLAEYADHRRERERLLVEALDAGRRSQDELLDAAWSDVPEPMRPAASLALRAHLEKLDADGRLPDGLEW